MMMRYFGEMKMPTANYIDKVDKYEDDQNEVCW